MPDRPDDIEYTGEIPVDGSDTDGEQPVQPKQDGPGGKGLRAQLERQVARVKELEAKLDSETGDLRSRMMTQEYERLGLDPEHGIGKAVSLTFDGEPEELAAFAEAEFDHLGPSNPMAATIAGEYSKLDAVGATAGSVPVPTERDYLAQAEARGDWSEAMQIKSNQLARLFEGRR